MKLGVLCCLLVGVGIARADSDDPIVELPGRALAREEISLEVEGRSLLPWRVARWVEHGAPLDVTVLLQGWIGHEQVGDDLRGWAGLDRLLPPTSHRRLATYGNTVHWLDERSLELGPGPKHHDIRETGDALTAAIEGVAHRVQLEHTGRRQLIIAVTDGCDRPRDRRDLRARLGAANIELHVVIYKVTGSCDEAALRGLADTIATSSTATSIADRIRGILTAKDDRTYAWFESDELFWDGEPHAYDVRVGGATLGRFFHTLPDRRAAPPMVGATLLALIVLLALRGWHGLPAEVR